MQEIFSRLSKEEKSILDTYNSRGTLQSVKESETKLKTEQESLYQDAYSEEIISRPLRILQTKIFNKSSKPTKPQTPTLKDSKPKPQGKQVTKSSSINRAKARRNSSKSSVKSSSSKSSCKSSFSRKCRKYSKVSNSGKVFDICKLPNWKYEVNKLIRTVFRHNLLCGKLRDEINKLGGSKILNEYKKVNNS